MALFMEVRLIGCTGQSAHENRAPLGDGILKKHRVSHARRHLGPIAGACPQRQRAWNFSSTRIDTGNDPFENFLRRMLNPGSEIQGGKIVLPKLDSGLQGLFAGKPRLDRRTRGPACDAQHISGGGQVKILGHYFPMHFASSPIAR